MPDFILNGQASGNVANVLLANNADPNALRPYMGEDGRTYLTVNENGKERAQLVTNATATLRKDDWIALDNAILKAAKPRLKAWGMLQSAGLTYGMPNGMAHTVLQYEDMSDILPATVSMDGIRRGETDRPVFDLKSLPLPIIHKDYSFSVRQIMASRNGGSPLDTTMAELAGRRVAEEVEKFTLGVRSTYAYGGGTVYGLANYTGRLTKSMTTPDGTNGAAVITDILAMKAQSQAKYHYGPWFCFCSTEWDSFLDSDYSTAKGGNTLRDRIAAIEGVDRPITLDYLPTKTLFLVEKTSDVIRAVTGMGITTVQWESEGGLQLNYKVMAIMVPQLRADQYGNTGIVHGTYT